MRWFGLIGAVLALSFALNLAEAQQVDEAPVENSEPEASAAEQETVGSLASEESTPVAAPTAETLVVPLRPPQLLLADDFDDPSRAHLLTESLSPGLIDQGYVEGEFMLRQVAPQNAVAVSVGSYGIADISIAADARIVGPTFGSRGVHLACRGTGRFGAAGYWFQVRPSSAYYELRKFGGSVLASGESPVVSLFNGTNHLELDCIGKRITGRINGTEVFSVEDPSFSPSASQGWAYLSVGYNNGSVTTEARFDNLTVLQR